MMSLNALSVTVRDDRERFLVAAARRFQSSTGSSARYNALELLLIHVGDALGSSDAGRLERWAQRESRSVAAATIVELLHAVTFAILSSVESHRELFDAALLRLEHLERRVGETVRNYERPARVFPEASARSGACEAIMAFAASLDPEAVSRRRAAARLAENVARDLAFPAETVRDIRDAALLAVLRDIDRFGVRIRPGDLAAIAPLAALAPLVAFESDIEARTALEPLWPHHRDAVVLIAAVDAIAWPTDGVAGYLRSARGLALPPPVRVAFERAAGVALSSFEGEPVELAISAGGFSANF